MSDEILASIGTRWRRRKTAFLFFTDGKGVTDPQQKKALLVHSAGMDVQEVYLTLEEAASSSKEEANEYRNTRKLYANFRSSSYISD